MRTRQTRLILGATCALLAATVRSAFPQSGIPTNDIERVGQSGWQFLKINGDPRQAGMGSAFTAIAGGDANAVFGNPASIADVAGSDVQFNSVLWIADITHQSFSAARSFGDIGVFALSFATLDYGDIPETINAPIAGDTRTEAVVTGNTYTARDMALGLTYARKITENLSIGGSVRWLRESIAELSMTNVSFDFGTLYYTGYRSLRIAMAARNFGPDSHLIGWSEEYQAEAYDVRMPLDFRVGIAMDFFDEKGSPHVLTVALDGDHPNDGPEKIQLGAEYVFDRTLSIRGGYKFNYDEQNFTFGAGFAYPLVGMNVKVGYAYVNFGALKQVHMFSIGLAL